MKALSRFASLAAVSLAASLALGTAAHADPLKCKQEIAKDAPKFVQTKIKALQKCNDKVVKGDILGPCPDGDTTIKINDAASKLQTNIAKKCGGADKTCGNGDDDSLASIGWAIGACPGIEGGSCTNVIGNCNGISTCLLCVGEAAVDQAISLYYDDLQNSEFGTASDANKCQRAIGKNATKFLVSKNKALAKCEKGVLNGDIIGPCPDATVAQPAIANAESKKRASICKACGGDDKVCGGGDDLLVGAIGFAASCNNVTIPSGPSCAGAITTVQNIVDCVDCVSEFKADCLDPVTVPAVRTYPSECQGIVATPCPTSTPGASCPTTVQADADSANVDLDTGWTGLSHDAQVPSNARFTLNVSGCAGGVTPPCGVCNLTGPIQNAGGIVFNNHRCLGNTSIECTTDLDCGVDGPCSFFFGPHLPLSAGGVAVCVTNQISGPVTGTVNIETGSTETLTPLESRVYLGDTQAPCPPCGRQQCVGGGNDGGDCGIASACPGGTCSHVLKCNGGQRDNLGCTVNGTSALFGAISFDCPPSPGVIKADLPIPINYTTGTQTRFLTPASPHCNDSGFLTSKCFCDTCDNGVENPCSSNADCGKRCVGGSNNTLPCTVDSECPPSGVCHGGTTCGARRCRGTGPNFGNPCNNTTECPGGGSCGFFGKNTAPNQCDDTICTPNPSDTDSTNEGQCAAGPTDLFCQPHATFAGCSTDAQCIQFNRCVGGTNQDAIGCSGDSQCPGGTCEIQSCTGSRTRECFTDNGVIGRQCVSGANAGAPCSVDSECPGGSCGVRTECFYGTNAGAVCSVDSECPGGGFCGGGSYSVSGFPYPPCGNVGSGKIGGLFCIGGTSAPAVNNVSGLPGPGRVTIPVTYTFN